MRQTAINLIIIWISIGFLTNFVLNIDLNNLNPNSSHNTIDCKNDNKFLAKKHFYDLNTNATDEDFGRQSTRQTAEADDKRPSSRPKRSLDSTLDDSVVSDMSSGLSNEETVVKGSDVPPSTRPPMSVAINCSDLLLGQYQCWPPAVDAETQQPIGCTPNNTALVNCTLIPGLKCLSTDSQHFQMPIQCRHTNGYSYETALLLSVFLGMFGADRFYLGYPALGLLKFCTLGFLFLGQLIDIILIAMQIVVPADGSYYVIKYFGPKLEIVAYNDRTDIIYKEYNHLFYA